MKKIKLPIKLYYHKISGYCLIGAYLTVRNTFEKDFNPLKEEKLLYKKLKNNVNTVELIKLLNKNNYSTRIFSEKDYRNFTKQNNKLSNLAKNYIEVLNKFNIYEETGILPNPKLIKECLENGEIILANGVKENNPHMRIIFGYENEEFLISDTSENETFKVSFKTLKKLLKAPSGYWMIATKILN